MSNTPTCTVCAESTVTVADPLMVSPGAMTSESADKVGGWSKQRRGHRKRSTLGQGERNGGGTGRQHVERVEAVEFQLQRKGGARIE